MVYLRSAGRERYVIALNPSDKAVTANVTPLSASKTELVVGDKSQGSYSSGKQHDEVKIEPVSALVFKVE